MDLKGVSAAIKSQLGGEPNESTPLGSLHKACLPGKKMIEKGPRQN